MNKELEGKVVCFTIKKPKYQKLYISNEEDVDTIVINEKEYKCSDIVKNEKALEIIKNKRVDVDLFLTIMEDENQDDKLWSYNFWNAEKNSLTQEEYDLLKEILE